MACLCSTPIRVWSLRRRSRRSYGASQPAMASASKLIVSWFIPGSIQAADIDIHAREVLKLRDQLNRVLAHHTGQTVEQIAKDTDRDNFLGPDEAVEYGLVDRVLRHRGDAKISEAPEKDA